MAFASNQDRLDLIASSAVFGLPFVVRFSKNGRDSELCADDFDHAYSMAMSWKHNHAAEYVEILRVDQSDGSLCGGIGAL